MSLRLSGEDIYALDELVGDITNFWKVAFQNLPDTFEVTPVFLSVLPILRAIYRWSVALESIYDFSSDSLSNSTSTSSGQIWQFFFSLSQWNELIELFTKLSQAFSEISSLLPDYPTIVRDCYKKAEDCLCTIYNLLDAWTIILDLPVESD